MGRTNVPEAVSPAQPSWPEGVRKLATALNELMRRIGEFWLGHVEAVGSGTDYTLTTTLAVIAFGTSGNLEVVLPFDGDYIVTADVVEDLFSVTASVTPNYSAFHLHVNGSPVTDGQRIGVAISPLVAAIVGPSAFGHHYEWRITGAKGDTVSLYASQAAAITGSWKLVAGSPGHASIEARRV